MGPGIAGGDCFAGSEDIRRVQIPQGPPGAGSLIGKTRALQA